MGLRIMEKALGTRMGSKSKFSHSKSKSLTAKANSLMAKANRSRQKQIAHGKSKFTQLAKANHSREKQIIHTKVNHSQLKQFTSLVWPLFLFAILQFAKEFLVLAIVNVQDNNNIDQKKPVSTIFIRNLEMKSLRNCARVCFYI